MESRKAKFRERVQSLKLIFRLKYKNVFVFIVVTSPFLNISKYSFITVFYAYEALKKKKKCKKKYFEYFEANMVAYHLEIRNRI